MAEGDCDNLSSSNLRHRRHSTVVVCNCGLKARFTVTKNVRNRGCMYYGCSNYKKWVHIDEELYAETSATIEDLEAAELLCKVRVLKQSLEDARLEVNLLMDKNELLRKMVVLEGLKDHGYVVEGKLIFRRRDAILEELEKLRKTHF